MVALPVWLSLLIVAAAGAAGMSAADSALRRLPDLRVETAVRRMPWRFVAMMLPVTLLLPGYLPTNHIREWLWYLPHSLHYWAIGLIWTYVAALTAFLGAFTLILARKTGHAQQRQLAFGCLTMLAAVLLPQWTFTRPLAGELRNETGADGVILQSSGVSCAAASGANIARLLGLPGMTEIVVAEKMRTTRVGTTMPQAVEGMRALGIRCTPTKIAASEIDSLAPPAFLYVDHEGVGRNGHAIVLVGRAPDQRYRVIDPLVGKATWTREQLLDIWHGLAISCRRASD